MLREKKQMKYYIIIVIVNWKNLKALKHKELSVSILFPLYRRAISIRNNEVDCNKK